MSHTVKHFVRMACVVACLALLGAGCAKKRIYVDPNPPGATPQQSRTAATPAAAEPAAEPAAGPDTASEQARPLAEEKLQPVELGTALDAEPDLLSGTAGVLDDELIGFPLADGSSYDADTLIAGHRTLPLGSRVEVTDTATGRTVLVTIADRGPFDKARVVDLSRKAAAELGMEGSAEVSLKVVGATVAPAKTAAAPTATEVRAQQKTTPAKGSFYVQVGAFEDQANAQAIQDALTLRGVSGARLVGETSGGGLVRVQAGPYADRAAAEKVLGDLRADYPAAFITIPD